MTIRPTASSSFSILCNFSGTALVIHKGLQQWDGVNSLGFHVFVVADIFKFRQYLSCYVESMNFSSCHFCFGGRICWESKMDTITFTSTTQRIKCLIFLCHHTKHF